jgi:hypothetical protein
VRMVRMWIVAVHGIVRVRRVAVHGIVRMVAVRRVAVRRVAVHGRMRMVVVPGAAVEFAAARCAHAVRGAGRFGVGGSGLGGLHRYSHRAAQLEEEQNKSEHRAARCVCAYVCGRHSYLREVLLGRRSEARGADDEWFSRERERRDFSRESRRLKSTPKAALPVQWWRDARRAYPRISPQPSSRWTKVDSLDSPENGVNEEEAICDGLGTKVSPKTRGSEKKRRALRFFMRVHQAL